MRPQILTFLGVLVCVALVSATRTPDESAPVPDGQARPSVARDGGDFVPPKPDELADPRSELWRRYFVHDDRYYATVDRTRIHVDRPLRPGEARPRLFPVSERFGTGRPLSLHDGRLQVRTRPGAPVTFYAADFGTFGNGERCITVRSDAEGLASTDFTYGEMASLYRVVAHSPDALGWVVFHLEARDTELGAQGTQKGGL